MSVFNVFQVAGSALTAQSMRLNAVASNLANADSIAGPDGKPLSKRLTPDLLVDDLARRFEERDRPLSELILERAIRYLNGEPELVEKKAA